MNDHLVPTIETQRLRLRAHKHDDFSFFEAMWANETVTKFIGGRPRGTEECWLKFLRNIGHWQLLGFGYWALEEISSGRLVGEVGLGDFKREMVPSIAGELEGGWVLAPEAHGKGFATEAMNAVLQWADDRLPGRRICCIIDPENAASVRVAEKLGFVETARTKYHGDAILLFHRAI